MTPLKTIKEEMAACIAAWEESPDATWAWCCHHLILLEPLTEPWRNRIAYIRFDKPVHEQAARLRNFRPVRVMLPQAYADAWKAYVDAWKAYVDEWKAYVDAWKAYESELTQLHAGDWPDHTWDGKSIFSK